MAMKATLIIAGALVLALAGSKAQAREMTVGEYLEDPEHKNDIAGFYLGSVFTGVNLTNAKKEPRLYCAPEDIGMEDVFTAIDRQIETLKKEKRFKNELPVEMLMLDGLISAFPCK